MSDPTLDRLDERTKGHAEDIAAILVSLAALRDDLKAVWRIIYWGSGVCAGFGAVAALIGVIVVPWAQKVLGLS